MQMWHTTKQRNKFKLMNWTGNSSSSSFLRFPHWQDIGLMIGLKLHEKTLAFYEPARIGGI
jgi:hypothetical protein